MLIQWIKQLKKSTNSVDYYNTVHLYILYSTVFELFEVHIYLTKSINVQPFYILIANAMCNVRFVRKIIKYYIDEEL